MAITKRGSRRIVVGGKPYRWIVRRKPTYRQGIASSPLTFAVEFEAAKGSVLVVDLDTPRIDNWLGGPGLVITPKLVAQCIREAIGKGWRPQAKGSPHMLRVQPNSTPNSDAGKVQVGYRVWSVWPTRAGGRGR
jgi:hypothetical protein